MNGPSPQPYRWNGEAMIPLRPKAADKLFVIGQTYALVEHEERSAASHRHFFASVNEAWKNLPEEMAAEFATPDALRKKALIKAGFRDERSIVCGSKAEALKVAAFIRPMDDCAIVSVVGSTVIQLTAKSQSERAMGKATFQASKDAVLEILSEMIGVPAGDLRSVGEAA